MSFDKYVSYPGGWENNDALPEVNYNSYSLAGAKIEKFDDVFVKTPEGKYQVRPGKKIVGKVQMGNGHVLKTWKSSKNKDGQPYGYDESGKPISIERYKPIAKVEDLPDKCQQALSTMFANKRKQVTVANDQTKVATAYVTVDKDDELYKTMELVESERRKKYMEKLNDEDSKKHFVNEYETYRASIKSK